MTAILYHKLKYSEATHMHHHRLLVVVDDPALLPQKHQVVYLNNALNTKVMESHHRDESNFYQPLIR